MHLLVGAAGPYEEMMSEVRCPSYLSRKLQQLWITEDETSPYWVITEVLDSLVNDGTSTLCDTLYRYIVLLGIPSDIMADTWAMNPVWTSLCEVLGLNDECQERGGLRMGGARVHTRQRQKADLKICRDQYTQDKSAWSLRNGTHSIMIE